MRVLIALAAALSLAACATVTPGSVHMTEGKALIAAESALDAAVIAADAAVNARLTSKAQNDAIVALAPRVASGLAVARTAYAAGDNAAMAASAAQLAALTAQLAASH